MSRSGLWATVPLASLFIAASGALRYLGRVGMGAGLSGAFWTGWLSDLAIAGALLAVFVPLLSRGGTAVRRAGRILYVTAIVILTLIAAARYFYAAASGARLTWTIVRYWVRNFSGVNEIIRGRLTPAAVAELAAGVGLIALLAALPGFAVVRGRIRRKEALTARAGWTTLAGIAATAVAAAALGSVGTNRARGDDPFGITPSMAAILKRPDAANPSGPAPSWVGDLDVPLEFERAGGSRPPNIVLIILESENWKWVDLFRENGTTPFLKSLAGRGRWTERFYTVVPHTTKALVPILAGLYPALEPIERESFTGVLPPRSAAHILRSFGYRTAFFQTARNDFENRTGLVRNFGFDLFRGMSDLPPGGFEMTNGLGMEDRMMLEPALRWVDEDSRRPFFLTLLTISSHDAYGTPRSFAYKDYGHEDKSLNDYCNAIRYTDDFVRDFVAGLERRNLLATTTLILLGDHGEGFREHGLINHNQTLWEEGLRTFAVLCGPGIPGVGPIGGYRSVLDTVPTICELAGLRLARGAFLGESLLRPVAADRLLFFSRWSAEQALALRRGPIKTVYDEDRSRVEVYDSDRDPLDLVNLALRPPYDEAYLLREIGEMKAWARAVGVVYRGWQDAAHARVVGPSLPSFENRLEADFEGRFRLRGFDLSRREVAAGSGIRVRAVLEIPRTPGSDFRPFVNLRSADGSEQASYTMGQDPTALQKARDGDFAAVNLEIQVPKEWAPGPVEVLFGIRDVLGRRFLEAGSPAGLSHGRVSLGTITVKAPTGVRIDIPMTYRDRK